MTPIHGNIAISAPLPGQDWSPDGKKLSIAPIMGGGLIVKRGSDWVYADFSNPNYVEGSVDGFADGFYFVYVYEGADLKPKVEFSTDAFEKKMAGGNGVYNIPVDVKLGDPSRTLVGFCYVLNGVLTFDATGGRSLTGNYYPVANKFPIRTPVVSGFFTGDGQPLPKDAIKLDAALDTYVITAPCASGRFIAQGFIENTDPTSRTKIYIRARSGRWPAWAEQSIATRVYGSGGFCISYGTAFNADCAIAELWAATERGTASYSAQITVQLMAA